MQTVRLECPDCSSSDFSWVQSRVQFGDVHRTADGTTFVEATKAGRVLDDDVGENGVHCTNCGASIPTNDLATPEKTNDNR